MRWVTLGWGGAMINFSVLWDCVYGSGFSFVRFLIMLPICLAGGWFVGTVGWSSNESRYQKYLAGGRERQLRR